VNSGLAQSQRMIWSLWVAAGIAFVGGLLPLVFGGTSSRFVGVVVPFTIAAIGLAAIGFLRDQGRTLTSIIYFIAGLAIVFGLMSMFSLPLRLAALGSCPVAPQPCPSGLPRVLTDGENNGMGAAAAFGIAALFVGFFGLIVLYRRYAPAAFTPPVRKIPPMPTAPTPMSTPSAPTSDSRDYPGSATAERADSADKPATEASKESEEAEELELPAPEELPELPAHESSASTT
jgi:hypothetical protein